MAGRDRYGKQQSRWTVSLAEGFEAGNLNVPSLAAWEAGLKWLNGKDLEARQKEMNQFRDHLWDILSSSNLGRLLGHPESDKSVPVVSLECRSPNCAELAALLDSAFQIETRSGLHCAGAIHQYLGPIAWGERCDLVLGIPRQVKILMRSTPLVENSSKVESELDQALPVYDNIKGFEVSVAFEWLSHEGLLAGLRRTQRTYRQSGRVLNLSL